MKNGFRSHRGRSAIARSVMMNHTTNAIMPSIVVTTTTGEQIRTSYFGGDKKGGIAPNATGNMRSSGMRGQISSGLAFPASRPNFNFVFKTNPGPRPYGHSSSL